MEIDSSVNEVTIRITKARIRCVIFQLKDGESPTISATVELLSSCGNKITEVTLSTDAWNENSKLSKDEVSPEVYEAIGKIVGDLKGLCARKINNIDKLLA